MTVPAKRFSCAGKLCMVESRWLPAVCPMATAAAAFEAGMERIPGGGMTGRTIIQDCSVQQIMFELFGVLLAGATLMIVVAGHAIGPCEATVKGRGCSSFRVDRVRLVAAQALLLAWACEWCMAGKTVLVHILMPCVHGSRQDKLRRESYHGPQGGNEKERAEE